VIFGSGSVYPIAFTFTVTFISFSFTFSSTFCPFSFTLATFTFTFSVTFWYSNLQDELICSEGWSICTIGLLFTTDTIKTLAKLLNEVICFEECGNLGITREVGMSDVVWFSDRRQKNKRSSQVQIRFEVTSPAIRSKCWSTGGVGDRS